MTNPEIFYEKCNLNNNPFRPNPTHELDPRNNIWVGYEREKKQLWNNLVRSRSDQIGSSNLVLLYGDLGSGKSHALFWSRYKINVEKKDEFNSVSYYIQTLKKEAGKLSFAAAFSEDFIGKSNIIKDILEFRQFISNRAVRYKEIKKLPPTTTDEDALKSMLGSADLYNLAINIAGCKTEQDILNFINPDKLKDYRAITLFTTLMNLFTFEFDVNGEKKRFKKCTYLFIDELDLLAFCTPKETREVNDMIRHIVDFCPQCFCFILAFTATAAEINVLFADYVISRVRKQIKMNFLEIDDSKEFVKEILNSDRKDPNEKIDYFPFSEDAVERIVSNIVSITPRKIINAMHEILEELRLTKYDFEQGLVSYEMLENSDIIDEVFGED